MKQPLLAGGLSLAVHAGVLLLFLQEPAASRGVISAPREQPVQLEVMRLTGVVPVANHAVTVATPIRRHRSKVVSRPGVAAPIPMVNEQPTSVTLDPFLGTSEANSDTSPDTRRPAGFEEVDSAVVEVATTERLDLAALSLRLQQVALGCYPAAARRFRQTGVAQIRFCVDAVGRLRESKVIHSTGSEVLDRAASDCVVPGAAPFGPETFSRCFTVPVQFNL